MSLGLLGPWTPISQPVYHLAPRTDWEAAQVIGDYAWSSRGITYRQASFVHCSFEGQVDGVRRDFYGDLMASDHVVLRIDPDPQLPILVEDGYPHLFAPLPVQAAQVFPGFP